MTERVCQLCPGRTCVDMSSGRLVNDNQQGKPIDLSKINMSETNIEDCEIRSGTEANNNLVLES